MIFRAKCVGGIVRNVEFKVFPADKFQVAVHFQQFCIYVVSELLGYDVVYVFSVRLECRINLTLKVAEISHSVE